MKFILIITAFASTSAEPTVTNYDLPMSLAQCASIGKSTASDMTDADAGTYAGFACQPVIESN